MNVKELYRYLGTLANLVEHEARAIETNVQRQSSFSRVAHLKTLRSWVLLNFLVLQIQQRQRLGFLRWRNSLTPQITMKSKKPLMQFLCQTKRQIIGDVWPRGFQRIRNLQFGDNLRRLSTKRLPWQCQITKGRRVCFYKKTSLVVLDNKRDGGLI